MCPLAIWLEPSSRTISTSLTISLAWSAYSCSVTDNEAPTTSRIYSVSNPRVLRHRTHNTYSLAECNCFRRCTCTFYSHSDDGATVMDPYYVCRISTHARSATRPSTQCSSNANGVYNLEDLTSSYSDAFLASLKLGPGAQL